MKELVEKLSNRLVLSFPEAKRLLLAIAEGTLKPAQIAAMLGIFRARALTVQELSGFREAMLELAIPLRNLEKHNAVDLCGTGGDGKDTFNISTLAAFVVAACGLPVTKHGNYGVSSVCGSSNVLEKVGIRLRASEDELEQDLDKAGICFIHAPYFHPAMKNVGPIRRELGFRSFFNVLGPLVNPARPRYQVIGVPDFQTQRLFAYLMQQERLATAAVTSFDGYDEISLTGPFRVMSALGEHEYAPGGLGLPRVEPEELTSGGSIESAAEIFMNVLSGRGTTAQRAVVSANAGLALSCASPGKPLRACIEQAAAALDSGKAKEVFDNLTASR